MPKRLLLNLQVLRFIAATMVLYSHLLLETGENKIPGMKSVSDGTGIGFGIGVDLFFIVSGFIMYYITAEHFGQKGYTFEFLKRRVIRVVPLYWIFTGLMLVSFLVFRAHIRHTDVTPYGVLASFFFIPFARVGGLVQPVLELGWTLEYEIFFYVCYGLALLLPKRIGLTLLVIAFVVLDVIWRFVPLDMTPLKFWSNPIIIEFLMGILLAHLFLKDIRLSGRWAIPVQIALIAVGLVGMAVMVHYKFLDRWIWGGLPVFAIALGVVLAPDWTFKPVIEGGNASYSLYLSHPFTLNLLAIGWTRFHLPLNGWLYVAVGMALCLAVAYGVYAIVENTLLKVLRAIFDRGKESVSA